ncbi:MAG: ORF6N domain-containing protein [Kiritimatiellae bacterium]|nr:ORF6N domain-containing protein [Kiritimatiellia bacterium]
MNGEDTNALVGPLDSDVAIKSRIFTIRGVQVMLDSDLAKIYQVETRVFNQSVKRNESRFPSNFRFRLSMEEYRSLISQIVTSKEIRGETRGGRQKAPYVFTEQGVAMLSGILNSEVAVQVSIRLMNVFVAMRKAIASVAPILSRLDVVERRQIADQQRNEERFDTIFKAMDGGEFPPQKVFFDGRHYEAYSFAKKLVGKAAKSILLVDGYCDDVTLDILSAKRGGVKVTVATVEKTPITDTAVAKFNKQNSTLEVRHTGRFHDRFLVIDGKELYHFGASLKDLGRHYCAVSRMDAAFIPSIMQRM